MELIIIRSNGSERLLADVQRVIATHGDMFVFRRGVDNQPVVDVIDIRRTTPHHGQGEKNASN